MSLRVGIAGAGQAGDHHAVGFATTAAEVVAIADLDEALARSVADRYGAAAVRDWRALLDFELDILVVALPHNLHLEPAAAAAERGVHVLMEKPLATTLDDGKRIVEVCRQAGVKLTISFVHRFREELQLARRWLARGEIGTPQVARETMGGQRGAHQPDWIEQRGAAGGGVLMYSSIHGIDRLRWLLASDVVSVTAHTRRFAPAGEVEQSVVALLTFSSGAVASLSANAPHYRVQPRFWETELYGSEGLLRLRTRQWAEYSNDRRLEHVDTQPLSEQLGPHYNFGRQAEAFVAAIRDDREPAVTAADGLRSLEVALAIYRSAETGETVMVGS